MASKLWHCNVNAITSYECREADGLYHQCHDIHTFHVSTASILTIIFFLFLLYLYHYKLLLICDFWSVSMSSLIIGCSNQMNCGSSKSAKAQHFNIICQTPNTEMPMAYALDNENWVFTHICYRSNKRAYSIKSVNFHLVAYCFSINPYDSKNVNLSQKSTTRAIQFKT